ncbi:MAG: PilZ domain-containing protein [Gammaproteobacteria bacterium]|nr:PilZ domain-containing protein [Gammaproteobacteria bacterium]
MNDGHENRRSFRVSESAYIKYEILDEKEFAEGLEHRKTRLGESDSAQALLVDIDARLSEAMFALNGESNQYGKCLTLLNDKLNVVIEQLPALRQSKAALASSVPQTCDVGADGIVFASAEPLEPGTKLSIQLLLASDNRYIESFCRVVRNTGTPAGNDEKKFPFGIAVEFQGMKQSQREMLIQHMFNRESETLRMRRLQTELDDE